MHLQVGDHAPAFTGKDQEEKAIQLANFAGKKLVLYFYPQDNTPGCTAQAYNLRDNYQALQQAGVFSIYFYNTNPFHKSHFVRLTPMPCARNRGDDEQCLELSYWSVANILKQY